MLIRPLVIAAALLASSNGLAQTPAPPTPPAPGEQNCATPRLVPPRSELVRLSTTAGDIVLELETERAPITAANFLRYVDQRRLDGVAFYRAMRIGDGGLIQGGTRGDRARVQRPIAHEPTTATCLSHIDMAISMARGAPGSADGDFFIIVGSQMTGLNANPAASGDNQGFAVFGRVVTGQDVVRTILAAPTSPTEGVGVMRGQMLSPVIRITTARRQPRAAFEMTPVRPPLPQPRVQPQPQPPSQQQP